MKLREREHGTDFEVNLTPLIDVVFLLLIFFVLTTTFQKEARLQIDLPTSSSSEQMPLKNPLEIAIDATGLILVGGEPDWKLRLQQDSAKPVPAPIVLREDRQTPHGSVVEVMNQARTLNLLNLSILTEHQRND